MKRKKIVGVLADAFQEAYEFAGEQEKKVLFTYEELFGQP